MDDAFSYEGQKTITNLSEHVDRIVFVILLAGLHELADIAIAKFLNNVVIFAALHDVNKLDDVRVMDWLHDFDLLEESAFQVLVGVDWIW